MSKTVIIMFNEMIFYRRCIFFKEIDWRQAIPIYWYTTYIHNIISILTKYMQARNRFIALGLRGAADVWPD